jgi:DNA gyrase/topoisomerase IV subunit A
MKDEKEVMISTSDGMVIRFSANSIPIQGRNTQGVRLTKVNVKKGEKVAAVEGF